MVSANNVMVGHKRNISKVVGDIESVIPRCPHYFYPQRVASLESQVELDSFSFKICCTLRIEIPERLR